MVSRVGKESTAQVISQYPKSCTFGSDATRTGLPGAPKE